MKLTEKFEIRPNQRVLIVGMTGTGKSQLAEYLCREFNSLIVLDYKHEIEWEGFKILNSLKELSRAGTSAEYNRVILRVPYEWEKKEYDTFFKWVLQRKKTRVYVDEGMVIGDNATFPKHLKICAVVGRSLGIGMIVTVQRPATIPKFLMTDSEHKFVFYLQDEDDQKRVEKECGVIDWDSSEGGIPHESFRFIHSRAGKKGHTGPYILSLPG